MSSSNPVIVADNISALIDGQCLLKNVSISVNKGEIVSIIGPNGAGKTTLLRALCGELSLQKGTVEFNQKILQSWSLAEKAQHMAVLSQFNTLAFAFTVREVVSLGRTPHLSDHHQTLQLCEQAMQAFNVAQLADRVYPTLSGGEQQRVQLARVLVQVWQQKDSHHRLLILDEPLANLDLGQQHQTLKTLQTFAKSGVGIVMVLHDLSLAAQCSDRLVALKQGHVIADGAVASVLTESILQQLFSARFQIISHPQTGSPIVVNIES